MTLSKIKYKDFTFPNNPETTGFKCDRSYIKHKYPEMAGEELEDFGVNAIVITGSGVFFGDGCYNTFKKLYKVYQSKGVGSVSHPIFTQITRGLMTSLEATVDAEKNVIHYSFEIVGDTKPNVKENIGKHAVKEIALSAPTASIGHKVGDIVQFSGGTHYISSSSAKGYNARAGQAKITLGPDCKGNGGAHPWHLIHTDSSSNVYGWVDEGTFS